MCDAIGRARHEVWLATYIFHHDGAGRLVADALVAAARRGVRVRVVVDGFGSRHASLPAWRSSVWHGSGVALAVFRPLDRWTAYWLQPGQLRRLHQKLLRGGRRAGVRGRHQHHRRPQRPQPRRTVARAAPGLRRARFSGPAVAQVDAQLRRLWVRPGWGATSATSCA
jgi:hypothetical protein